MLTKQRVLGLSGLVVLFIVLLVVVKVQSELSVSTGTTQYDSLAYGEEGGFVVGAGKAMAPSIIYRPEQPQIAETTQAERLIIKTGQMSIVVQDVAQAVDAVTAFVTGKGGFVVSSNVYENGVAKMGDIMVRIPVAAFDSGVEEMKKIGDVKSEQVNGQDVTAEFVDLESQIKNLQATEQQFLQIMTRAQKIEDILAVQRELSNVRGQIESIQGRMNYLSKSAELSTLSLHFSTDPATLPVLDEGDKWKPLVVFKEAVRSLLEFGQGIVNGLIWLVVYLPIWILIVIVAWYVRRKWWLKQ